MNTQKEHKSLEFNPNDLVLIVGECIGENCVESVKLALELGRTGLHGGILTINTVQRRKKYAKTVYAALPEGYDIEAGPDGLFFRTLAMGNLVDSDDIVREYFEHRQVRTVIINCWELAARDYRTREKLQFMIMRWLEEFGVSVLIYAQRSTAMPKPGYGQRGGFGRLAGVADVIHKAYTDEEPDLDVTPKTAASSDTEIITPAEMAAWLEDADVSDMNLNGPAKTVINIHGHKEIYLDAVFDLEENDEVVQRWDRIGIPRGARKIYFSKPPGNSKTTTIIEERIIEKDVFHRTAIVYVSDYEFPSPVPYETAPLLRVKLENYLDQHRKPAGVVVQNEVVENTQVAEAIAEAA